MDPLRVSAAGVAVWLLSVGVGFAKDNEAGYGDAEHGRGLAIRWCSSCHVVATGQGRSIQGAPPFAAIAQSPDFNSDRLAHLLLAPHPNMEKLALSRAAVDDIAAYIASLKR